MRKMLKSMVRSANRFRPAALMLQIMKQSDPQGNGKKSVDVDKLLRVNYWATFKKRLKMLFSGAFLRKPPIQLMAHRNFRMPELNKPKSIDCLP